MNDMIFDVDKFVKYLAKYKDKLPELYYWNVKIDKLKIDSVLSAEEIKKIDEVHSPYEKGVQIKKIIGSKLKDAYHKPDEDLFKQIALWVIKDWGGITSADGDTIELVYDFLKQEKPNFNRIASTSKVGAFFDPDKNVIYDSRVAYSLNWIILSENAGLKFFPIPEGRNSKMSAFDMNVLIRLKNISNYRPKDVEHIKQKQFIKNLDKNIFIDKQDAYFELNNLVKQINQRLWEGDKEKEQNLYYTEMLLFSIADREVYTEITNHFCFDNPKL